MDYALLSSVCTYLAIVLGVGCLFTGIVTVAPWQQEAFNRACLTFLVATLAVAMLAAVFRGVARARRELEPYPCGRRMLLRLVFWVTFACAAALLAFDCRNEKAWAVCLPWSGRFVVCLRLPGNWRRPWRSACPINGSARPRICCANV